MDKVDEMPAGRELDALIANLMGWSPGPNDSVVIGHFKVDHKAETQTFERASVLTACPPYSTDIGAAWEVVEELETTHCFYFERVSASRWACFWPFDASRNWTPDDGCFTESDPLAICRAALKTLEDE